MKVHTPAGNIGRPPVALAPSPPVLTGLRLGLLDNTKPNAGVLLDRLGQQLAERTGAEVAMVESKNAALAAPDDVLTRLENGVHAVLTGSAD